MSQAKRMWLAGGALAFACVCAGPLAAEEAPPSSATPAALVDLAAPAGAERPKPPAPAKEAKSAPSIGPDGRRPEVAGYQSLPRWIMAFSLDEMASALEKGAPPSSLPWMTLDGQAWSGYLAASARASAQGLGFGAVAHAGIVARLATASAGDAMRGLYEITAGRVFEFFFGHSTAEDALEVSEARRYAEFVKSSPWSKFDFASGLAALWDIGEWDEPRKGSVPRRLERLFKLTVQWGVQAVGAWAWDAASAEAASKAPARTAAVVRKAGGDPELATVPRGAGFAAAATDLAAKGDVFESICGNEGLVMASVIVEDTGWLPREAGVPLAQQRMPTRPGFKRLLVEVPVGKLDELLLWAASPDSKASIEHVFDY